MNFERKTTIGNPKGIFGILIKIILIFILFAIVIILIDRVNFPSPTKKIEKIIPNENFKIVK